MFYLIIIAALLYCIPGMKYIISAVIGLGLLYVFYKFFLLGLLAFLLSLEH